jgi:hypothetical protein
MARASPNDDNLSTFYYRANASGAVHAVDTHAASTNQALIFLIFFQAASEF